MDRKTLFLFFATATLATIAAPYTSALSSDSAVKTVAASYLEAGEEAFTMLSAPVDFEGERYWLVGFRQITSPDSTNLFLPIADTAGFVEASPDKLGKLIGLAGKLEVLSLLKKNKLSIDDLDLFLSDSEAKRDNVENNYVQLVKQQLELAYQNLDFASIEVSLDEFKQKQEKAREAVQSTRSLQERFAAFPSTAEFDEYYRQYNATYNSFDDLTRAAEKYSNSLLVFTETIANSAELNYSDKTLIKSVLERLGEIGDYRTFKNTQLSPAEKSFSRLDAASGQLVDDRVGSTLDRIARKEAQTAYTTELENRVNKFLTPEKEFILKSCDIDATNLKNQWLFVRTALKINSTRENLLKVPMTIAQITGQLDNYEVRYNDCINTPVNSPQPTKPDNSSLVNILIIILVILVAFAGYKKYKEIRENAE